MPLRDPSTRIGEQGQARRRVVIERQDGRTLEFDVFAPIPLNDPRLQGKAIRTRRRRRSDEQVVVDRVNPWQAKASPVDLLHRRPCFPRRQEEEEQSFRRPAGKRPRWGSISPKSRSNVMYMNGEARASGARIECDFVFHNEPAELRQALGFEGLVVEVAGETRCVEQPRQIVGAEVRDAALPKLNTAVRPPGRAGIDAAAASSCACRLHLSRSPRSPDRGSGQLYWQGDDTAALASVAPCSTRRQVCRHRIPLGTARSARRISGRPGGYPGLVAECRQTASTAATIEGSPPQGRPAVAGGCRGLRPRRCNRGKRN